MNQQDNKYYEQLFETFGTDGWATLVEEAKNLENLYLEDLVTDFDEKSNCFRRGQLAQIRHMVGLADTVKEMYELALQAESEESDV